MQTAGWAPSRLLHVVAPLCAPGLQNQSFAKCEYQSKKHKNVCSIFKPNAKEICDAWTRHCRLIKEIDPDLFVPKHHLMLHCNDRIVLQGNPWSYTTFLDESMNKELKRVLRLCHQATFETTAMVKLGHHLDGVAKRMRRHL